MMMEKPGKLGTKIRTGIHQITEDQWLELADSVFAKTVLTTRFARGHAVCAATPVLRRAAGFAAWKHEGQSRKGAGNTPYIHHPIEVTAILAEIGWISDFDVLQAALLHDTIEDTETSSEELETHLGFTPLPRTVELSRHCPVDVI